MLRLAINVAEGDAPPANYALTPGRGVTLTQAVTRWCWRTDPCCCTRRLARPRPWAARGGGLTVVNHPWLNGSTPSGLRGSWRSTGACVVDDHAPVGGLADRVARALADHGLPTAGSSSRSGSRAIRLAARPARYQHHGLGGALAERLLAGAGTCPR
jgi:hypothetical protein